MNILLIAPHPFYQDRGTPIAVDMLLTVLSAEGHRVDVCTFPEGETRMYPGVTIHRARPWGKVENVRPGFSLKKLYTDVFLFFLVRRLCRRNDYDIVHAIEEAGFVGWFLRAFHGIPYVYDMDSVLSDQMVESRPWLAPLRRMFAALENKVVAEACVLAPMCQALSDRVAGHAAGKVVILKDVSLIQEQTVSDGDSEDLRSEFGIAGPMAMYVGNLEPYQGIELMIRGFAVALREVDAALVIVGGKPAHIRQYRELARQLGIDNRVHLIGPRPVSRLADYLRQADVLVSPRTKGNNTPMKIYSYLHSGVALLATDLPTHTQVLTDELAELVEPRPEALGHALAGLLRNEARRLDKGRKAAAYAAREHSFETFQASVRDLYRKAAEACQSHPA
jgi:glycosyltransferase involved in cell wall biosynthesis